MSKDNATARYYVYDQDDNKHRIFPMKIGDKEDIIPLFERFNDSSVLINLLVPKIDDGVVVRDDQNNIVRDEKVFEAMMTMAEYATKETREQLLKWVDIVSLQEVIETFLGVSQLKKKTEQE